MTGATGDLRPLLDELERRLVEVGAPVAGSLRPGLDDERVRAGLAEAGAPLHEDLCAWFGWHDGAAGGEVEPGYAGPGVHPRPENTLVADWQLLSLADALRTRRFVLETAAGLVPGSWVPVLSSGGRPILCVDAGADGSAAAYVIDDGTLPPGEPLYASLADFVRLLLRVFDEGLLAPHPEGAGVPWLDSAALTGELRRLDRW